MRKTFCLLVAAVLCLVGSSVSKAEDISKSQPTISNPSFALIQPDRKLEVSFDYSDVAGDITDAELKLVIFEANGIDPEAYHSLRLGLTNVLSRPDDYTESKEVITKGKLKFVLKIPEEFEIIGKNEISGFSLELKDALGRESSPSFIEVKIQEKRSI